jgi:hypothetical protein
VALPEDRTIPADKFPEKVRRFVDPDAAPQLKQMLAQGAVPMKPLVQVCALHQVAHTADENLASAATSALRRMPTATIVQIASRPLIPVVLDWVAAVFAGSDEVIRAVLLNRTTDDDTFIRVAKEADEATCDLIARNQTRLIQCPPLVEALYYNRNLRASTADRMLDFAARNLLDLPSIPNYREIVAEIAGELPQTAEEQAAADRQFREAEQALRELTTRDQDEIRGADIYGDDPDVAPEAEAPAHDRKQVEAQAKRGMSAAGRIRDLNVAQKVRLAVMGNAAERAILIRDPKKVVSRAVIRSPAISDTEAMAFAKNKSLRDEIIAFIANNKKWTRHYRVKLSLVMNPKTPVGSAMKFLTHLRPGDLRSVASSKGVPGPVANTAKQLLKKRMK